ncbi:MAG: yugP [Chloroflexota bacterium]|nr:yugP [Chloroflexota bacterium]
MFFDPLYIGLIVATLLIAGGAQLYIRSTYGRWNRVPNGARLSGAQIAEFLRERATFGDKPGHDAITAIKLVPGNLSDHFDPRDRSLGLSQAVAEQPTVAAMAIAAHEVGHAQQHAEGSALMKLRSLLVPAATLGPNVAYILIFAGLIFQLTGLVTLGILFFGIAVLFSVLTLPVEIGASRRALAMLDSTGIITSPDEKRGAQSMLTAAALTYVAAAVTSILTLLYYLTLARRSS